MVSLETLLACWSRLGGHEGCGREKPYGFEGRCKMRVSCTPQGGNEIRKGDSGDCGTGRSVLGWGPRRNPGSNSLLTSSAGWGLCFPQWNMQVQMKQPRRQYSMMIKSMGFKLNKPVFWSSVYKRGTGLRWTNRFTSLSLGICFQQMQYLFILMLGHTWYFLFCQNMFVSHELPHSHFTKWHVHIIWKLNGFIHNFVKPSLERGLGLVGKEL